MKVKFPLFSREVRGAINDNIIFSVRKSGQQVRFQKPSPDRRSQNQLLNRQIYSDGAESWQSLTFEQKQSYIDEAIGTNMTGYNLYMKNYLLNPPSDDDSAIIGIAIIGAAVLGQD